MSKALDYNAAKESVVELIKAPTVPRPAAPQPGEIDQRRAVQALQGALHDVQRGDLAPDMVVSRIAEHIGDLGREAAPVVSITDRITPITDEWINTPPPRARWLLLQPDPEDDSQTVGWVRAGKVGMLAGAGGVGKTLAAIQLAVCIATGRPWLGATVATRGRVLLALGEEDADEVRRRIYGMCNGLNLTDEERAAVRDRIVILPLVGVDVRLVSDDPSVPSEAFTQLREVLQRPGEDWAAVIFDPLARFAGVDENDNAAATRAVSTIEQFLEAPGNPAVLVVHHTSQASRQSRASDATAARGGTAWTDGVRWVATLNHKDIGDTRAIELVTAKSNYAPPGDPILFTRDTWGALWPMSQTEIKRQREAATERKQDERSEEIEAAILRLVANGHYTSITQLREATGAKQTQVAQAVGHLVRLGRIATDGQRQPYRLVGGDA